jgi:hypothetical protein
MLASSFELAREANHVFVGRDLLRIKLEGRGSGVGACAQDETRATWSDHRFSPGL